MEMKNEIWLCRCAGGTIKRRPAWKRHTRNVENQKQNLETRKAKQNLETRKATIIEFGDKERVKEKTMKSVGQ